MASTDATAIPIKNQAYRVTFPIWDADGDLVTGAAGLDSEVSKDGGTFTDCTNEATEIATSSGIYYLDLSATEMNADTVAVIVKTSTSGAKTTALVFYPAEAGDIIVNVKQINGTTQTARDIGASVLLAADQAVNLTKWAGQTVHAVSENGVPVVDVHKWNGTDVSAPSTAGIPEVNVKNIANAAVSTSSAQIGVNVVNAGGTAWGSGAITAASIANGAIDNATFAADVGSTAYATNIIALAADKAIQNAALATAAELAKVPKSDGSASWNATALAAINAEVDTALNTAIPGSPTANSINERVATMDGLILGTIAAGTHNPQSGDAYAIVNNGTYGNNALKTLIDTVDNFVDTEVAAIKAVTDKLDTAMELDSTVYRFTTNALEQAPSGTASDPWETLLPGSYGAGTAGKIVGDNINAPIATVDTVVDGLATELAKVPKSDSTVTWNATALASIQTECTDALNAYDPPTKTEMDSAFSTTNGKIDAVDDYVDTEVAAVLAAVDTEVAAIKAKTDNLPDSPAAVGSPMTLTSDYDAAKTASSQTSVNTVDGIVDDIIVDTGTTIPAVLTTIEGKIDAIAPGAGAIEWTYTVATSGGVPISGVSVWCTSDVAGTVVLQSGTTNASGVVTFWLAAGTVYVWCYKEGYNFTNPDVETVS